MSKSGWMLKSFKFPIMGLGSSQNEDDLPAETNEKLNFRIKLMKVSQKLGENETLLGTLKEIEEITEEIRGQRHSLGK